MTSKDTLPSSIVHTIQEKSRALDWKRTSILTLHDKIMASTLSWKDRVWTLWFASHLAVILRKPHSQPSPSSLNSLHHTHL